MIKTAAPTISDDEDYKIKIAYIYFRHDESESSEETEEETVKPKKKKKIIESDESESEASETEESSSSEETEDEKPAKKPVKKTVQKKRNAIESETDDSDQPENAKSKKTSKVETEDSESSEEESEQDESGDWEEIEIEESKVQNSSKKVEIEGSKAIGQSIVARPVKGKRGKAEDSSPEKKIAPKKKRVESTSGNELDEVSVPSEDVKSQSETNIENSDKEKESDKVSESVSEEPAENATPKKGRARKKSNAENLEANSSEVVAKKRGRKPKQSIESEETGQETQTEETPVKKKRGRKAAVSPKRKESTENDVKTDLQGTESETRSDVEKQDVTDETEKRSTDKTFEEKVDAEKEGGKGQDCNDVSAFNEKGKDDSPLSARNKQNAPVGVVKPEVRQGVIVENKHAIEARLSDKRPGEPAVNPLQGMRDLAMGTQPMPGQNQSSFTPYSQSNYGGPNMPPPYMNQPGFQSYQQHRHQFGPDGPRGPYPGPQTGAPHGPSQGMPQSQFPQNQGPLSPNSYQQPGSYMGSMQHGPPGYYQPGYRPPMEGYGPPGQPYQQGPFPPSYSQGPYSGPRPGFADQMGQYPMGSHGPGPQGGPYSHGMPYNYPHMPPHGPPIGPHSYGPQTQDVPGQGPMRPQARLAVPAPSQQSSSPTQRSEGSSEGTNRGFMMDNILKPSPEAGSNDVEDGEEVSDIDRYTSFLCKDK